MCDINCGCIPCRAKKGYLTPMWEVSPKQEWDGAYNAGGILGTGFCLGNKACKEAREAELSAKQADTELAEKIKEKLDAAKGSPTVKYAIIGIGLVAISTIGFIYFRNKS